MPDLRDSRNDITLVSVVIPVFNTLRYLPNLLKRLQAQTFKYFEVIFIDDCSNDGSYDYLKKIVIEHSNMSLIHNECNCGVGISLNRGIAQGKGKYILVIASDDLFSNDFIRKLYEACIGNAAEVAIAYEGEFAEGTRGKIFVPDRSRKNKNYLSTYPTIDEPAENPYIYELITSSPCDKMISKDLIASNDILFSDFPYTNDMSFSYSCVLLASKIVYVDKAMYFVRTQRSGSVTSQHDNNSKSYIVLILEEIQNNIAKKGYKNNGEFWKFVFHRIYQVAYNMNQQKRDLFLLEADSYLVKNHVENLECLKCLHEHEYEYAELLYIKQMKIWNEMLKDKTTKKKTDIIWNIRFATFLSNRNRLTDYYVSIDLMSIRNILYSIISILKSKLKNTLGLYGRICSSKG